MTTLRDFSSAVPNDIDLCETNEVSANRWMRTGTSGGVGGSSRDPRLPPIPRVELVDERLYLAHRDAGRVARRVDERGHRRREPRRPGVPLSMESVMPSASMPR